MRLDHTFQQLEGIVEQIGCAMHGRLELLHGLNPLAFLLERLKAAMLLLQNGLLRIQHQTIRRVHTVSLHTTWGDRNRAAHTVAIVRK